MTLVSDIITRAYREQNLRPLSGSTPNANQIAEGVYLLNDILLSTIGNEVGDGFVEYTVGTSYNDDQLLTTWIPDNVRVMLNLTEAKTYNLDPRPKEGQRLAIVDVLGNLATYNVTINPNGRRIEDASTLVLSTDDLTAQWLYRSDTGNWVRISELISSDTMPFPREFDQYFVTMLAARLNPRYGQELSSETMRALVRSRSQLRSRYNHGREIESDVNPRGMLMDDYLFGGLASTADFSTGRPYTWR